MSHELNEPKEVSIVGGDGKTRKFVLGKVPWLSGGRKMCMMYPTTAITSAIPKFGEYAPNEEMAVIMYKHIDVITEDGNRYRLETPELVNNHLTDFMGNVRLEAAMLEHNLGFSVAGKMFGFLETLTQAIEQSTSKILTALLEQSSRQTEPTNKS